MTKDALAIITPCIGVVIAGIAIVSQAQPKALTEHECRVMADAALVARAHALSGIAQDRGMLALALIYEFPTDQLAKLASAINVAAYAPAERRNASDYGVGLYQSCVAHKGDLTPYLGASM